MPTSTSAPAGTSVIEDLKNLISAGIPSTTDTTALQTFIASVGQVSSELATESGLPSAAATTIATFNDNFTAVGDDIGLGNTTQLTKDIGKLLVTSKTVLIALLANIVATNVSSTGCSGYDTISVTDFQTQSGIPVTGVYDAATVTSIESLFGSSAAVPPACGANTNPASPTSPTVPTLPSTPTSPTTPTSPVSTTAPTTTASTATTVLAVGAGALAIGTLAYFLYQGSQVAAVAALENPRRRRSRRR